MRFLANRPERSEAGFEPDASIRDPWRGWNDLGITVAASIKATDARPKALRRS